MTDEQGTHVRTSAASVYNDDEEEEEEKPLLVPETILASCGPSLGLILSAFEQLKTGRCVDYHLTMAPTSQGLLTASCSKDVHRPRLLHSASLDASICQSQSLCSSSCTSSNGKSSFIRQFSCQPLRDRPRPPSSSMKREGSEEDGESSSSWGSTGHGRSGGGSDGGQVSGEGRSSSVRTSRDDRAASEQRLPVTADEIVNMPVEEFNNYISTSGHGLSSDQIQLMKDIRRRGKNKVAAQNCRRRKIDNMSHLEKEIMALRQELQSATNHRNQLARQRDNLSSALRSFDSNYLPIPLVPPPTSLTTTNKPKPTNAKRNDLHTNDLNDQSQRKRKRDH